MKSLLISMVALVATLSFVVPIASARPASSLTATVTCDRGAGATVDVRVYAPGNEVLIGSKALSCGVGSESGSRAARGKIELSSATLGSVQLGATLTFPGAPVLGCYTGSESLPATLDCPIEDGTYTGPGVHVTVR